MRVALLLLAAAIALAIGSYGWIRWQSTRMLPPASNERVTLSPDMRVHLLRLRREQKFQPHDYPPLGYTGTETSEEQAKAVAAVNRVIDGVLSSPHGLVTAEATSGLIGRAMQSVSTLPTEDRDRTADYMLEI